MKSIAYVLPYFGKFPKGFELFLLSCKNNSTIDWLIFTDDRTEYDYPSNVKVTYYTFEEIKDKVQKNFNFKIVLDKPYKFCDYKPAYGEIFSEELKGYDFWGMCDLDLAWGDIRKFITDDLLNKYERIGFLGHSTIYKNTTEVNSRYRTIFDGNNYPDVLNPKQLGKVFASIYSTWDMNTYEKMLTKFKLPMNKKIKNFSKGMKMKY